jgi:hypothetical protein
MLIHIEQIKACLFAGYAYEWNLLSTVPIPSGQRCDTAVRVLVLRRGMVGPCRQRGGWGTWGEY